MESKRHTTTTQHIRFAQHILYFLRKKNIPTTAHRTPQSFVKCVSQFHEKYECTTKRDPIIIMPQSREYFETDLSPIHIKTLYTYEHIQILKEEKIILCDYCYTIR